MGLSIRGVVSIIELSFVISWMFLSRAVGVEVQIPRHWRKLEKIPSVLKSAPFCLGDLGLSVKAQGNRVVPTLQP
jgi:hypothetical protein